MIFSVNPALSNALWQCRKVFNKTNSSIAVSPVVRSQSVLVSGLNSSISDSSLKRYMENKRRGAGVKSVETIKRLDPHIAVVHFLHVDGKCYLIQSYPII